MALQLKKPLYDPNAPENRYPKWVHIEGKPSVLVQNEDEEKALSKPKSSKEEAPVEDDKDALLAQAALLGLTIDKRSGVQKIKDAIAAAQKSD